MSHRIRLLQLAVMATTCALLPMSPQATAGEDAFLYGLDERGDLTVNGVLLEKLKGQFKPDNVNKPKGQHRWVDVVVDGPDRYVLRLDGLVQKNGGKLRKLPFALKGGAPAWWRLAARDGVVYALRTDGRLAVDGNATTDHPGGPFVDLAVPAGGSDVWALRLDGAVFAMSSASPAVHFDAGTGGTGNGNGSGSDTSWARLVSHPLTTELFALRADGHVFLADTAAEGALDRQEVTQLPFPAGSFQDDDLYVDLEFAADGRWFALRKDGAVFASDGGDSPVSDHPPVTVGQGNRFVDLAVHDDRVLALRRDGPVFEGNDALAVLELPGSRAARLVLSDVPPDLDMFTNRRPRAAVYKARVVQGEAVGIPVIVVDPDKASEELLLDVDLSGLPGAVWDESTRTVVWDDAGPRGRYRFDVLVDDGSPQAPRRMRYRVLVSSPNDPSGRNRAPTPWKVSRALALTGFELHLPILASDRDGDALTISVEASARDAFSAGASFDGKTNTLSWTPGPEDLGRHRAVLRVSDGTSSRRVKIRILVESPLIFS